MGATFASFQVRDCSVEEARQAMRAFLSTVRDARPAGSPRWTGFAVETRDEAWRAIFPEELYGEDDIARFAAASGKPGVYLECADSDTWSFSAFTGGQVLARLGDDLQTVAAGLEQLLGASLPGERLADALEARRGPAEAALGRFARLLGIETSQNAYGLIRQGVTSGIELDELDVVAPEPPAEAVAAPFDVYVSGWLHGRAPAGTTVAGLVREVAALLDSSAQWFARSRPTGEGGQQVGGGEGDLSSLPLVDDLQSGDRLAHLEVELDDARLVYESLAPGHHSVLMRASELLAPDGAPRTPKLARLMLGAEPALHELLFDRFGAWYGCVMPIPVGDDRGELARLVEWPPFGHWLDYLSAGLVEECGGLDAVSRALTRLELTTRDSNVIVRLPVPVERALDPILESDRRRVYDLIAGASHERSASGGAR